MIIAIAKILEKVMTNTVRKKQDRLQSENEGKNLENEFKEWVSLSKIRKNHYATKKTLSPEAKV